jgi:hypothetical protein
MYVLIIVLGLAATALFVAGFGRGLRNAIAEYRSNAFEPSDVPDFNYAGVAAISVVASAVIIALAGVNPVFIYLGPLLAVGTAAGVGIAFLVEKANA